MSKLVRVDAGAVVEIIPALPAGFTVADVYHPTLAAQIYDAPEEVDLGWTWDGDAFAPQPAPILDLVALKARVKAAIELHRAAMLAAGYPVSGLHVALDDASRADLTGMSSTALAALSGVAQWPASYAEGWITTSNVRIPLPTPADGLALAAAAGDWYARIVQRARTLKDAALAAEDEAALGAIDIEAGWPVEGA